MRYCLTCGNLPVTAGTAVPAAHRWVRRAGIGWLDRGRHHNPTVPASGPLPPPDPAPRTKGAPSRRTLMIAGGGVALWLAWRPW